MLINWMIQEYCVHVLWGFPYMSSGEDLNVPIIHNLTVQIYIAGLWKFNSINEPITAMTVWKKQSSMERKFSSQITVKSQRASIATNIIEIVDFGIQFSFIEGKKYIWTMIVKYRKCWAGVIRSCTNHMNHDVWYYCHFASYF